MAETPLATRMRPRTLDEVVGQQHLLGPGKALTSLVGSGHLPSLLLWGPAGSGKTTLAFILGKSAGGEFVQLSAVASGVADARKVMGRARNSMLPTVLFVDEVHRWSKSQQDVLLPTVEDGTITLIGATTENPYFSLVSPLLSRTLLLRLNPLEDEDVRELIRRALTDEERGLGKQRVTVADGAVELLVSADGGGRRVPQPGVEHAGHTEAQLNLAEAAIYLARAPKSNGVIVSLGRAQDDARSNAPVPRHLRAAHYPGAAKLGHGKGYKYPHDYPDHVVEQE